MTEEKYAQLEELLDVAVNCDNVNNRAYYRRQFEDSIKLVQADIARQLTIGNGHLKRIADALENPQTVKFIEIPEKTCFHDTSIRVINPRSIAEYSDHYILIDNAHSIQTTLTKLEITALIKGGN